MAILNCLDARLPAVAPRRHDHSLQSQQAPPHTAALVGKALWSDKGHAERLPW